MRNTEAMPVEKCASLFDSSARDQVKRDLVPASLLGIAGAVGSVIQINQKGIHASDKAANVFMLQLQPLIFYLKKKKEKKMMAPYTASQYYTLSCLH